MRALMNVARGSSNAAPQVRPVRDAPSAGRQGFSPKKRNRFSGLVSPQISSVFPVYHRSAQRVKASSQKRASSAPDASKLQQKHANRLKSCVKAQSRSPRSRVFPNALLCPRPIIPHAHVQHSGLTPTPTLQSSDALEDRSRLGGVRHQASLFVRLNRTEVLRHVHRQREIPFVARRDGRRDVLRKRPTQRERGFFRNRARLVPFLGIRLLALRDVRRPL